MYCWLIVFILPINSAINPIIYTIASPTGFRQLIVKLISSLINRINCTLFTRKRIDSNITTNLNNSLESNISDLCQTNLSNQPTNCSNSNCDLNWSSFDESSLQLNVINCKELIMSSERKLSNQSSSNVWEIWKFQLFLYRKLFF